MSEFKEVKAVSTHSEILDDWGNAIVFGAPATTTNRNPNLDQVIRLFHDDPSVLDDCSIFSLRKFGEMLLAANDSLANSPLWNDIGGFVDEDGRTLPAFAPSEDDTTAEVERKRWYLSRVIIPADIEKLVTYLKDNLNMEEPPADDRVPTTGPAPAAFTLRRLLSVFSIQ